MQRKHRKQPHPVLLECEKAFDEVHREAMFNALRRMNIDDQPIGLVKQPYKNTSFKIEIEGNSSDWQKQHTGIRQGCPLSPDLFLIVMTVMFEDVHSRVDNEPEKNGVPGASLMKSLMQIRSMLFRRFQNHISIHKRNRRRPIQACFKTKQTQM